MKTLWKKCKWTRKSELWECGCYEFGHIDIFLPLDKKASKGGNLKEKLKWKANNKGRIKKEKRVEWRRIKWKQEKKEVTIILSSSSKRTIEEERLRRKKNRKITLHFLEKQMEERRCLNADSKIEGLEDWILPHIIFYIEVGNSSIS